MIISSVLCFRRRPHHPKADDEVVVLGVVVAAERGAQDVRAVEERPAPQHTVLPLLRSGGKLVYATCSVLPAENVNQLRNFLADHVDARDITPELACGLRQSHGVQLLPGQGETDGFYYACIEKD